MLKGLEITFGTYVKLRHNYHIYGAIYHFFTQLAEVSYLQSPLAESFENECL